MLMYRHIDFRRLTGRDLVSRQGNGTRATFAYDIAGHLLSLSNFKADGTVHSGYDYQYDASGLRTRQVQASGRIVSWSYNSRSQLTNEHRTGGG